MRLGEYRRARQWKTELQFVFPQKYLTSLRKENEAFQNLIHQKAVSSGCILINILFILFLLNSIWLSQQIERDVSMTTNQLNLLNQPHPLVERLVDRNKTVDLKQ